MKIVRLAVLLVVLLLGLERLQAGVISSGGRSVNSRNIYLHTETINTVSRENLLGAVESDYLYNGVQGKRAPAARFFLVHFSEIQATSKAALSREIEVLSYIPDNSFLVYKSGGESASSYFRQLQEKIPQIQWVNVLDAKHKILYNNYNFDSIRVHFRAESLAEFIKMLEESNVLMQSGQSTVAVINEEIIEIHYIPVDKYNEIASFLSTMAEIYQIEPVLAKKVVKPNNYRAHFALQAGDPTVMSTPAWNAGILGDDQIIGCGDSGIDLNHCFFYDPDQSLPNAQHRKVIAYLSKGTLGRTDTLDGHGTHVVGTILGNPSDASAPIYNYRGQAPNAKLSFIGLYNDTTGEFVTPDDMFTYYQVTQSTGANIHLDAWNSVSGPFYTSTTTAIDQFQYQYPNYLIIRSAGNIQTYSQNAPYSLTQESASKNSLVVGSVNEDQGTFTDALTPNSYWDFDNYYDIIRTQVCSFGINVYGLLCEDMPAGSSQVECCATTAPIALQTLCCASYIQDQITNNSSFYSEGVVSWFSAQGPTSDGRIKPDIVAPGSPIISSRSNPTGTADHCNAITDAAPSVLAMEGTSQAAAVAAGAAALVRQYYTQGFYSSGSQDAAAGFAPSASLIKATMINIADGFYPDNVDQRGFGQISLGNLPFLGTSTTFLFNQTGDRITNTDQTDMLCFEVTEASDLHVTLVWTDPPSSPLSSVSLVNDLDLLVASYINYNLTSYYGNGGDDYDSLNNVEHIVISGAQPGRYDVYVFGTSVPEADQPYSLVIRGNIKQTYCSECYYSPDSEDDEYCDVKNGIGIHHCTEDNTYSECKIYSCNSGYVLDKGITKECVTTLALTLYNIVLLGIFGIILIGTILFIFFCYKSKSLDQSKYGKVDDSDSPSGASSSDPNGKETEMKNVGVSTAGEGATIESVGDAEQQQEAYTEEQEVEISVIEVVSIAKPEAIYLVLGILLSFVDVGLGLAIPLVSANIFDLLYAGEDTDINNSILTFALIIIGMIIVQFTYGILLAVAGHKIIARLRKEMFHSILRQDMAFFNERKTGELMSRLASDVGSVRSIISDCVPQMTTQLASIGGSLIMLFIISWKLSLVVLCPLPILLVASHFYGGYIEVISIKVQDALADAATHAAETLFNIRTVRWFSAEERENTKFTLLIDISYKIAMKMTIWNGIYNSTSGIFEQISIFILLWYGTHLVRTGDLTPSMLIAFNLFLPYITQSVTAVSTTYTHYKSYKGSSYKFFEIMQRVPSILNDVGQSRDKIVGNVEFNNVTFVYPGTDATVLDQINISFKPGTITALIGPSGGGKSTVLSLIGRIYDINGGTIAIDGFDIRQWNLSNLHHHISIVSQEPALFTGTIAENVAYGMPTATRDRIIEACKQANAHEFIIAMPQGYDTMLGERGTTLSGGQKQRIAIARAIIKNPTILLLDEATSALDVESERLVQDALDSVCHNRTVIIVAHRLSTILTADIIAVVSEHKISEKGTPEELLAKKGLFYEFVQIQYGSQDGEEVEITLPNRKNTKNADKLRSRAETIKQVGQSIPIPNPRKSVMYNNNNNNLMENEPSSLKMSMAKKQTDSTPLWRKGKKHTKRWTESKSSLLVNRGNQQSSTWQRGNVEDKLQRVLEKTRKKGFYTADEKKDIKGALLLY